MVQLDRAALAEELPSRSLRMQKLASVNRTNLRCLMLTAVGGAIIMGAIGFGFYMSMPASGLNSPPASSVLTAASGQFYSDADRREVAGEMQDASVLRFKQEAYNVLMRSIQLLEVMEELEPLLENERPKHRMKRDLVEPVPNRISRDDRSEEVTYGVRKRVQREEDLGTLPIAYGGFYGNGFGGPRGPRRKRHASLEELERAKRNAQQDFQRLEHEYYRCRKEAPNAKICDQIYDKLHRLSEEVNARFMEMANLLQSIQDPAHGKSPSFPSVFFGGSETSPKPVAGFLGPETHRPMANPKIETVEQLVNHMNITKGTRYGTQKPTTKPLPSDSPMRVFDPRLHKPVENSSIKTLDDLLHNVDLGAASSVAPKTTLRTTVTSSEKPQTTEPYQVASEPPPNVTTTIETELESASPAPTRPPSSRWTTTKSPSQAARNLHDVVEQLQLAQMLQLGPTPFHEELLSPPSDINELVMSRSRNRDHTHHDQHYTGLEPGASSPFSSPAAADALGTLRASQQPLVVGPSAPFLNLCDQLRSAGGGGGGGGGASSGFGAGAGHVKPAHAGFQMGGQPGIPITGEATKASSQIIVNSAYGAGYVPNTVCFYQNAPPAMVAHTPYAFRPAGTYSYPNGGFHPQTYQHQHQQQQHPAAGAMINMPVSIQNHQHSGARRPDDATDPNGPILLCSMLHNGNQQPGDLPPSAAPAQQPSASSHPTSHPHRQQFGNDTGDQPGEAVGGDDLASMFAAGRSLAARAKGRHHCRRGYVPCFSSHQCVRRKSWCDSKTDCMDGSDESACSCVSRLPQRKLCDGYADCPLAMDEMGCFGCEKFSFSCFHTADEYRAAHRSSSMCYTLVEKCDGFDNCLNRKDEQDCTMLVRDLGHYLAYSVPHSSGVLHRNYKGKWYPACHNAVQWARDACEAELGPLDREPLLSHGHGSLPGPYISQPADSGVAQPVFSETCNGVFLNVRCPPVRCGTSKLHEMHSARISVRARRNTTDLELVESVRIVGGTDAEPEAYPFIVGIFRDGKFHCGGSIYNEHWIISAAHCCDNFHEHYFEVRSGMLRKRSFAPQVQVTRVTHMIVHHAYSATLMANDIALMRVEQPFHYNRWVRPICLPEKHRTTNDRDWIWGPKAGTICTAVGWGALRERGGAPDHLKQVSVPVLSYCKHKSDRDSLQICAAEEDGGHDACQGDSGGPFVCRSDANPFEWYLAGVVSHGEGCARAHEPGVYTRVALFIDWIAQKLKQPLPARTARADCPGMRCIWGGGICLPAGKKCNGFVNCLGGEDESGCEMDQLLRTMSHLDEEESEEMHTRPRDSHSSGTRQLDAASVSGESEVTAPPAEVMPVTGANSATTSQQESAEPQESMIVTHTVLADVIETTTPTLVEYSSTEASTTEAVFSEASSTEASTTEVSSTTEAATTEEGTTEASTTEASSTEGRTEESSTTEADTTEPLAGQETTFPSTFTNVTVETTDSSANIFPKDSRTTPAPMGFELSAPETHPTTEPIWKALEKAVKEVRGEARAGNESASELAAEMNGTATTSLPKDGPADIDAAATPPPPEDNLLDPPNHPFFSEIEAMHQEKHKRVALFRMTVHNLHTKASPKVQRSNETVKYRQFWCQNITQRINVAHRCDRFVDCEDGSDEFNCTCRDFLKDKFDFLICDGKTDCLDRTDELNCMNCDETQYACRISQECIPREQVCNGHPDCRLHEDELDCLALTDGQRVYFDANNLTLFRNTGIVTKNTNGTWEVVCGAILTGKTEHAVEKICSFLGFAGSRNYSLVSLRQNAVPPAELLTPAVDRYLNLTPDEHCQALRVSCAQHINATEHEIAHFEHKPTEEPVQVNIRPLNPIDRPHHMPQIVFQENAHIELIENFGDDYDWPWNTNIYLDGVLICSGLIIDANWIIAASSCTRLVNLRHQYVAVVAGGAKSYLHIAGPYEQVVRVDCYHFIPEAETVMLHLERKLNFSRHVLPTFVPENQNVTDSECLAVGQDKFGRTKTLRVHLNGTDCQGERVRCYHKDLEQPYYHHEYCYTEEATRSGVIVCKTNRSGWYPVGFYQNKRGLCGFNEVVRVTSLVESYHKIQNVLQVEQCAEQYYTEPSCAGKRCRYGKCVGEMLLCDRKLDCGDGSDEDPAFCAARNQTRNCLPHQLRCANGKCIEKSRFCDRRNDCGDSTDEPHDCSCYTYLRITDPGKICDGVRNCWDKSDENPRVCRCHATSFRCGESDICVPYDFVCDKERDCPDGEDELYCYALQQNSYEAGYGELMEQSYGIWHSKCFPKTAQFGDEYMREICEQLGYGQVRKIYGRAIVEESRLRTTADGESQVDKLRRAATKTVVQNKFSKVVINANHTFYMKPSRPMFKVINWDQNDQQNCHRLELLCAP